jgi:cytoskeletal protein CcmA (bactofilin family)
MSEKIEIKTKSRGTIIKDHAKIIIRAEYEGDIQGSHLDIAIRKNGVLKGSINCIHSSLLIQEHSEMAGSIIAKKSSITVRERAKLEGNITADEHTGIIIADHATVEGDIEAKEVLIKKNSAYKGEIKTKHSGI